MFPPGVQEHGGEDRDPAPPRRDFRGDERPLPDERFAASDLEHEDGRVEGDEPRGHQRDVCGTPGGIA